MTPSELDDICGNPISKRGHRHRGWDFGGCSSTHCRCAGLGSPSAELLGQGSHSAVRPARPGGASAPLGVQPGLGCRGLPECTWSWGTRPFTPPVLLTDMCAPTWAHCLCGDEAGLLGGGRWVTKQMGISVGSQVLPESVRMLVLTARGLGAVNCLCCSGQAGAGLQPGQGPPARQTSARGAWEQWGPFPRHEDSGVQGKGALQVRTLCPQRGGRSNGEGKSSSGPLPRMALGRRAPRLHGPEPRYSSASSILLPGGSTPWSEQGPQSGGCPAAGASDLCTLVCSRGTQGEPMLLPSGLW